MSNDLLAEAFAYQRELLEAEDAQRVQEVSSSVTIAQVPSASESSPGRWGWFKGGGYTLTATPSEGPHGPNFTKYLKEINKE